MAGFVTDVLARLLRPPGEQRLEPSRTGLAALAEGGLLSTAAGVSVGQQSVLSLTAAFACVRLLASSSAMLPLKLYERLPSGGKAEARRHPVYGLLHDDPNPEMSDFDLRQTLMGHLLSWGNGYAEIDFDQRGYPVGLWPLRPDGTWPVRLDSGELAYDVWVPGVGMKRLPAYRVLHLRGLGSNGLTGYSVVRLHAETFGYAFATKLYGAYFFGNGARPGVVLKHPGQLGDKAFDRLRESFTAAHEGLENSHRVKILEEGMDLSTVGIPPEEAQFLETQKFQVSDVARIYGVPPHMIQDVDGNTSWGTGVEQMSIGFAVYTLQPWLTAIEKGLRRALLLAAEREQYLIEHKIDGLLRGDQKSRYEAYNIGRQGGWLSVNDVRKLENMNPVEGGDVYLQPLNMVAAGTEQAGTGEAVRAAGVGGLPLDERARERVNERHGERCTCGACGPAGAGRSGVDFGNSEVRAEPDEAQEYTAGQRRRLAATYVRLFEDGAGRLLKRELADLRRAVQKYLIKGDDLAAWRDWLDGFYADLREVAPEYLAATLETLAAQVVESVAAEQGATLSADDLTELAAFEQGYLETWAGGYVASHNRQMRALTDEGEVDGVPVAERIVGRLDGWEETEAERQALAQAFEAVNAVSVAAYGVVGVRYLMWLATGESCPFCRSMSGRVAGIDAFFVEAGGAVPGAEGQTLTVARAKRHGPLHEGCDCVVVAV